MLTEVISTEKKWAIKIMGPWKDVWASSFQVLQEPFMDVQTPRMLVWWIAGRKCPEMMKIVGILGIPWILLILSIYWLYYPQPAVQQWRRKFNLKNLNTPMSKFACQAELQESSPPCPLGENETTVRQLTRLFVPGSWLTICNLHQPSVCLMSRTLSPDEFILLVSVCWGGNGVSSTGARIWWP